MSSSLVITEIGYICMILASDFKGVWYRKLCVVIFAPLMPAYYFYEVVHYELTKFFLLNSCYAKNEESRNLEQMSTLIYQLDKKIWALQMKLATQVILYQQNCSYSQPELINRLSYSKLHKVFTKV